MKLNKEYRLREIAGEFLVVRTNNKSTDMTKVISLNRTSAWLWQNLEDEEFDLDMAVRLLTEHYDVEVELAIKDVENWINTLKENGVIE